MTPIYQVGGSLRGDAPCYVERPADAQLLNTLVAGECCYVFNARQMGKSSLLVRSRQTLSQAGHVCTTLDLTRIGGENTTPTQWYKGIVMELWRGLRLQRELKLKTWWREAADVSLLQNLSHFLEDEVLRCFPEQQVFIFMDEIDSILGLSFPVDDLFALIRFCYNQRAINPAYNRLHFALFGVTTPADLIRDQQRTPFNIGSPIELTGFDLTRSRPLLQGLEPYQEQAEAILTAILAWTNGQPFLTQKLCQLAVDHHGQFLDWQKTEHSIDQSPSPSGRGVGGEGTPNEQGGEGWIAHLVKTQILENWETHDNPEHLRTIRDRILRNQNRAGRLLGIYQNILQGEKIAFDDSPDQIELRLAGLISQQNEKLEVKNPIYAAVFNPDWVTEQLQNLRPYSQTLAAWIASEQTDSSRLLRGQALHEAQQWAQGKRLSDRDYLYLAASVEVDRQETEQALEAARAQAITAQLAEEHQRLIQEEKNSKLQRLLLVIVSGALAIASGLGLAAFWQYRKAIASEQEARQSEIRALIASAESLLTSEQQLPALLSAIAAAEGSERLTVPNAELAAQTDATLRQAIFNTTQTNTLNGHQAPVFAIAFSPDGQYVVTGGEDQTIRIWRSTGQLIRTLTAHESKVRRLVFSPDGKTFASASLDGTVKLWSLAGELQQTFSLRFPVFSLAFSPDGQTLAMGTFRNIQIWQREGDRTQTFPLASGRSLLPWDLVFSPDGQTLFSGHGDGQVRQWTPQGDWTTVVNVPQGVYGLVLTPDGQTLVLGLDDGGIMILAIDPTGRSWQVRREIDAHASRVWDLALSPDGQQFASVSQDGMVKLWSLDGQERARFSGDATGLLGVAFSPDGEQLATAGQSRQVKFWQVQHPLLTVLRGHQDNVRDATFHPQGEAIATASTDGTAQLWQPTGKRLAVLQTDPIPVWSVRYAPDGRQLAAVGGTVNLWQPDGQLSQAIALPETPRPTVNLSFSPDGKQLALGLNEQVYFALGARSPILNAHTNVVNQVIFSPDGQRLATSGDDHVVKLWAADGQLQTTLTEPTEPLTALAFSADGQTLAAVGGDPFIHLWDLTDTGYRSFRETGSTLNTIALHPDGNILAVGGNDRAVELWTMAGEPVQHLTAHRDRINRVEISPDGQWLVSASNDDTAILWNLDQILRLEPLIYACDWVKDYLRHQATGDEGFLCRRDRN
ncbi:AAA-like domain-containing protein [Spirulina major CS-329]|uniref:AAA-like domain-containing protein n=1 Tax=Spirulina TaxID=1154 RepID=UPI00232E7F28|nr:MULTISPECIES: AAA-like domain-containing protein [Spirulina]MDB9496523.1 AAA-like domain-containing protein [Spirulina subsalsa CS-330]MDB9502089.1 AAA-like domain-containing protein [Spirulina major CS-329]